MKIKCPVCGKVVKYENNPWRPFCSKSCKIIDLWNWFHEKYSIKVEEVDEKINIEEVKDDQNNSMWRSRKNGK
ncbi:MAG: DNA gyrase inhibitor YacG [Thermodesulfovibrio sp.]|nr:DNA gyrase inhibitor YacG [Thermodesulfovibrio sp.]